ncbi:chromosome partitioning protein, ParB family [Aliiruegeria lutimaris]|uniref:Chromosome partitioning protein, ParB family n=2 Tax=Aliiruegeria lutimaris TaxID=571298 RepID=A0A1G9PZD7_9RHOB|nr:chromosome partitioning protein, ParB family [Aliiruegeria lutimaris]
MGGGFVAMVEENEIRATLSPYERGRIAVVAARGGAFVNTEAAVEALFAAASKAKRSKIRSFAQLFEELGDLLRFPEMLTEKQGLILATALRNGGEAPLRDALEQGGPAGTIAEEWGLLEAALATLEMPERNPRRGGRPKKAPAGGEGERIRLSSGFTLVRDSDARGPLVRIEGREVAPEVMEDIIESIRRCLEVR